MYGSKDSKNRRTSKLHDRFKSYDVFFLYPADYMCLMRELAGEGLWLWLLALVTGGR